MTTNTGGCLCGGVRFATASAPVRITYCHCTFCQRATGSAYLVEPIFERTAFAVTEGQPKTYDHRSGGSGKIVTIHFCDKCGTKIFLGFERFTDVIGVFGGTFDDPNWFERAPENTRHIFLDVAQHGTVVPARMPTYGQHATLNDGTPLQPVIHEQPHTVVQRKPKNP